MIITHPYSLIFEKLGNTTAPVTACIALYNYADCIQNVLDSIYAQTITCLDVTIVDDCSQDRSVELALSWLERNSKRFNNVRLVKHNHNSGGPSGTRNTAISVSQTPYVFPLDADNLLYPRCIMRCLETLEASDASFVYPLVEKFGAEIGIMGNQVWNPKVLAYGNYIDNMVLMRKACCEAVGGYSYMRIYGWEDFDLWCKFIEQNYYGILVPEILARYLVHQSSLLRTQTHRRMKMVIDEIKQRHPWLQIAVA
jgi:glycosyltransferase involved in cell wall biosynthesis